MTFQSKKDAWLIVLIVAASVGVLIATVPVIMQTRGLQSLFALVAMLFAAVLPIWLVVSTRYIVDSELLRIHCGPFRWKIRLDEIESLRATRNPLSSPALSLDRVMIRYRNGRQIMVSPEDKQKFADALGNQLE